MSITYSIVIPTFNPGQQLSDLTQRIHQVFHDQVRQAFEIIIVDDGSSNSESIQLLRKIVQNENIVVILLSKNFGKPGAVMCGLSKSRGAYVITIDDDLQQAPEDIPKLLAFREHAMVTATHKRKHHTISQRLSSAVKRIFDRYILGYKVSLSPLKVIQRHVVDGMLTNMTNRPFIPALIREITTDVKAVTIQHHPSVYKESRYSFARRMRQFSNLLVGNSAAIMKLVGILGLVAMALSLIMATAIILRKLLSIPTQTGWISLMVTMLMIGGLNLGAIGMVGQYLIRILDVASQKPAFYIRETIGDDS